MRDNTLAKRKKTYLNFTHVGLIHSITLCHFYGSNRAELKHSFKMVKNYEGYSWNSFLKKVLLLLVQFEMAAISFLGGPNHLHKEKNISF